MSIFNEKQRKAMTDGEYICSECGGLMERSWKLYHCRQFRTKQSAPFLTGTHGVGPETAGLMRMMKSMTS